MSLLKQCTIGLGVRLCENCIVTVLSFLYFYHYNFSHYINYIALWRIQTCSCIANVKVLTQDISGILCYQQVAL